MSFLSRQSSPSDGCGAEGLKGKVPKKPPVRKDQKPRHFGPNYSPALRYSYWLNEYKFGVWPWQCENQYQLILLFSPPTLAAPLPKAKRSASADGRVRALRACKLPPVEEDLDLELSFPSAQTVATISTHHCLITILGHRGFRFIWLR